MKPRQVTQEDADFWSNNDEGVTYEIGPMMGRHLGAEDIPTVLKGQDRSGRWIIKVAWELDERDIPDGIAKCDTVWSTFFGAMPAADVVIL